MADEKSIIEKYQNNVSLRLLSSEYSICRQVLKRILIKNNIHIRTKKEVGILSRGKTYNYIGEYIDKSGYRHVRYNGKQILEHRLVYMLNKKIDKIPKGFQIHHIDGNILNNEISNLELLSKVEHLKKHIIHKKKNAKAAVSREKC